MSTKYLYCVTTVDIDGPQSHTVRDTKLRKHTDTNRLKIVKSQLIRTSSKVTFNSIFTSEIFTT